MPDAENKPFVFMPAPASAAPELPQTSVSSAFSNLSATPDMWQVAFKLQPQTSGQQHDPVSSATANAIKGEKLESGRPQVGTAYVVAGDSHAAMLHLNQSQPGQIQPGLRTDPAGHRENWSAAIAYTPWQVGSVRVGPLLGGQADVKSSGTLGGVSLSGLSPYVGLYADHGLEGNKKLGLVGTLTSERDPSKTDSKTLRAFIGVKLKF